MVAGLLTMLTLAVLQFTLALLVRNTVLDAAAEGARYAALADNELADGVARTRELLTTALGPGYAAHIAAGYDDFLGQPATVVTVSAPLPVIGLIGVDRGLEVSGHATRESLGR